MVAAFFLQFIALHFGRLSVVQPILTLELPFLVVILGVYFRIRLGWAELIGSLAAAGGLGVFLAHGRARWRDGRPELRVVGTGHDVGGGVGGGVRAADPDGVADVAGDDVRDRRRHCVRLHGGADETDQRRDRARVGDGIHPLGALRRGRSAGSSGCSWR